MSILLYYLCVHSKFLCTIIYLSLNFFVVFCYISWLNVMRKTYSCTHNIQHLKYTHIRWSLQNFIYRYEVFLEIRPLRKFLKKLTIVQYVPAIPLPGTHSKELKVACYRDACLPTFPKSLFTINNIWNLQ